MSSQEQASSSVEASTQDTTTSGENVDLSSPIEKDSTQARPKNKDTSSVVQRNPRLQALEAKKANLDATLALLKAEKMALVTEAKLPSGLAMPESWSQEEKAKSALTTANVVIKEHITLLHKYNEIKDIGQGLMGLVADKRGVRVATVMDDYGMEEKD